LEGFIAFLIIDLHILLAAYAYKRRYALLKWLEYPYYAEDDRELRLQRRVEDAQHELDWLRENKRSKTEES
jgi:hypothetical protein